MPYALQPMTAGMTPLPIAPQNRIMLRRRGGVWHADYIGPHAAEINSLFGTTRIPTAWTDRADWTVVLAEVRRLNPTCIVNVG